jgi:hypothetical protein
MLQQLDVIYLIDENALIGESIHASHSTRHWGLKAMFNPMNRAPEIDNSLLINYLATFEPSLFEDSSIHAKFGLW